MKFSPTVLSDYPEEEAPTDATDGPKNSGLVDAGCFEVSLYESLPPVKADPSMSRYSIHDIPDTKKIDKNKKFWLQPSATTITAGKAVPLVMSKLTYAKKDPKNPVQVVKVPYHTLGILKILELQEKEKEVTGNIGKRPNDSIDLLEVEEGFATSSSSSKKRRNGKKVEEPVIIDLT